MVAPGSTSCPGPAPPHPAVRAPRGVDSSPPRWAEVRPATVTPPERQARSLPHWRPPVDPDILTWGLASLACRPHVGQSLRDRNRVSERPAHVSAAGRHA
jgi:hypothetical protein